MPKNPHADFSPVLDGYSEIGAFRFWCQTALPLTYDDSLSYYELLNKVVNYLNHTISDLTAVENNTSALAEAYNQLQKYVNDYFDDLDVEAELRNVLDAMAEDGTLDALLSPIVENQLPGVVDEKIDAVVAEQIDGAVAGQINESVADQLPALVDAGIPGEVSEWLEENVDPVGSAVVVDSTLTISGAAADAKVTGDELSNLKTQLNALAGVENITWQEGYYIRAAGDAVPFEPYSASDYIPLTNSDGIRRDIYFEVWGNVATCVGFYDSTKTLISTQPIGNSGNTVVLYKGSTKNVSGCEYIRLTTYTANGYHAQYAALENETVTIEEKNLGKGLRNVFYKPDDFTLLNLDFTAYPNNYIKANGDLVAYNNSNVSDFIAIPDDATGFIKVTGVKFFSGVICVFYDRNQHVIEYFPHTEEDILEIKNAVIEIPAGTAYIRVGDNSYRSQTIEATTVLYSADYAPILPSTIWTGKKWACVGDSLTEANAKTTLHYYDYIAEYTGITPYVMGVSGSGYAAKSAQNQAFYQRISAVPTDSDVITIFGSFNDLDSGLPLGTKNDTGTTTLAGCMNTTLENLFTVFPLANVGLITSTPWGNSWNPYNGTYETVSSDYTNMLISIAEKWSIPVLDLYHNSGLRPWDSTFKTLAYSKDGGGGVHPDETGHKIIASKIEQFVKKLLLN